MSDKEKDSHKIVKSPPMLSVYLGPPDISERRLKALDSLAGNIGVKRSKLIQMIADGQLALTIPRQPPTPL